jgi:anti-sigma28 factor (negative regulator of flagellin synthesis)
MIGTDIVNEIAKLIRQRDVIPKDPKQSKEIKAKTGIAAPKDAVVLSKSAEAYAQTSAQTSQASVSTAEFEKEQGMKVERLRALVNSGNYSMDEKTVESIAERIANTLM